MSSLEAKGLDYLIRRDAILTQVEKALRVSPSEALKKLDALLAQEKNLRRMKEKYEAK